MNTIDCKKNLQQTDNALKNPSIKQDANQIESNGEIDLNSKTAEQNSALKDSVSSGSNRMTDSVPTRKVVKRVVVVEESFVKQDTVVKNVVKKRRKD
ncbi:MAG: hypothetical protein IPO21_10315 [Bacteroidales bacterium]|nr:hypothetical protein [Bacteroidales bacterium]